MLAVFLMLMASATAQSSVARHHISQDAKSVIRSVYVAAKAKDYRVLKALMVPEFKWSFSGDSDADQAIEAWKHGSTIRMRYASYHVSRLRCSFIAEANTI